MDSYDQLNDLLVHLFSHTMKAEERWLITDEFKDISVNDMHIIDCIGPDVSINMSAIAKKVGVTVGTLTIAINSLVRKGYVSRSRSTTDRRVVLISLTEKGILAYKKHIQFHQKITDTICESLTSEQVQILTEALSSLKYHFDRI